jgi:hypothetical protein
VNTVEGFAGDFSLATHVEGHPAETLVHVSVSQRDASRLVLVFSHEHEVLRDACCLLCGSIGTRVLLERGYTGPLITRPPLAAGGQFPTALTRLAYDRADAIANCRHCAHV